MEDIKKTFAMTYLASIHEANSFCFITDELDWQTLLN